MSGGGCRRGPRPPPAEREHGAYEQDPQDETEETSEPEPVEQPDAGRDAHDAKRARAREHESEPRQPAREQPPFERCNREGEQDHETGDGGHEKSAAGFGTWIYGRHRGCSALEFASATLGASGWHQFPLRAERSGRGGRGEAATAAAKRPRFRGVRAIGIRESADSDLAPGAGGGSRTHTSRKGHLLLRQARLTRSATPAGRVYAAGALGPSGLQEVERLAFWASPAELLDERVERLLVDARADREVPGSDLGAPRISGRPRAERDLPAELG